jgi:hypothetical protein
MEKVRCRFTIDFQQIPRRPGSYTSDKKFSEPILLFFR